MVLLIHCTCPRDRCCGFHKSRWVSMPIEVGVLPEITIQINGARLATEVIRALEKVRVALRLSQPAQCELTFSESWAAANIDIQLAPGTEISVVLASGT